MRVALISDIHGNLVALEAVLASIAEHGADEIVCLGDVATLGPNPSGVLARLSALGCPCIMGNHDEFLLDSELIRSYTEAPPVIAAVDWCRARMARAELDFVRRFARDCAIDLGGGATLYLFHGSPRSHMENLLATTPPDALDDALAGHRATVMAGGHTHIQMLRQHRGTLLVNPGSVGMPFEAFVNGQVPTLMPHAEYAIVSAGGGGALDVALHRVPVDRARALAAWQGSDNPLRDMARPQYG